MKCALNYAVRSNRVFHPELSKFLFLWHRCLVLHMCLDCCCYFCCCVVGVVLFLCCVVIVVAAAAVVLFVFVMNTLSKC